MIKINTAVFLSLIIFSISALADVSVRGYNRTDGTYVQPHHRSNPDGTPSNNWSTKGNINPHTGEEGTHNSQDTSRTNNW
jgi:hypothetical protein